MGPAIWTVSCGHERTHVTFHLIDLLIHSSDERILSCFVTLYKEQTNNTGFTISKAETLLM